MVSRTVFPRLFSFLFMNPLTCRPQPQKQYVATSRSLPVRHSRDRCSRAGIVGLARPSCVLRGDERGRPSPTANATFEFSRAAVGDGQLFAQLRQLAAQPLVVVERGSQPIANGAVAAAFRGR